MQPGKKGSQLTGRSTDQPGLLTKMKTQYQIYSHEKFELYYSNHQISDLYLITDKADREKQRRIGNSIYRIIHKRLYFKNCSEFVIDTLSQGNNETISN